MKYVIIKSDCVNALEKLVNADIKNGWIPVGGVSFSGCLKYSDGFWVQAMVKK